MTNEKDTAPEKIRLVVRGGFLDGHWYEPDAAISSYDAEFIYTRVRADGAAPVVDNWFSEDVCMFCGGKTAHKPDCSHGRDRAPLAATPACEHEKVMTDEDRDKADELKNAILDLCLRHKVSVLVALSATRCAAEGLEELINEQGGTVYVAEPSQSKGEGE